MKNKIIKLILVLLSALLLTGCWDSVEIDRKAFVSTIGIDVGADVALKSQLVNSKNETSGETIKNENNNFLKVTYGFPDIRNMDRQKGTAEEISITIDGYSMSDTYFKAIGKSSRKLHFGHSKLLLISDELFKYPELLNEVMDYIQREPSFNRTITMAIVEGKAKDYVAVKPITEDSIDKYITSLLGNSTQSGAVAPITLTKYIDMNKTYNISMLPVFSLKEENDIELTKMAIIKNFTIAKYLSNAQTSDVQILTGDIGACVKSINKEGHTVDYYIKGADSDLAVTYEGGKLHLNYTINAEGSLKAYYIGGKTIDEETLRNLEEAFNKSMEADLRSVIDFTRYEADADVLRVATNIRRYHRNIWKEVKDNWPETLKEAEISVEVNNYIRTIGVSN